MTPTVSVIIPAYNHRDFIVAAVESVLGQTFTDFELIVVDDGSPDDTAAVLAPFAAQLRLIRQANAGQAAARNRGLAAAEGEFVAFLDDDDYWPADKLARHVALLRDDPAAVLVYGVAAAFGAKTFLSPDAEGPAGDVSERLLEWNFIMSPGSTLMRTDAVRQVGGFDASIWGADDWDLYLKLAKLGTFRFDPAIALHYRLHENNASRDTLRMYRNARRVMRRHTGSATLSHKLSGWYGADCVDHARAARRAAQWVSVAVWLTRAVRINPRLLWNRL
jgi:glycosyltransferase involved in cell wall biosynthesis